MTRSAVFRFPSPGYEPDYWNSSISRRTSARRRADVMIISPRMRRLVLQHRFSFLFNTTILALAVDVAAGLL